jgi:hypothetical protein
MKPFIIISFIFILSQTGRGQAWGGGTERLCLDSNGNKMGQLEDISFVFAQDTTRYRTIINGDTIFTNNPYGAAGVVMLIHFYRQYSQECWNDSTAYKYAIYIQNGKEYRSQLSGDEIDLGINPNYRGIRIIYEHRDSTFPDFMKWIEERMKEK